jgi:hypothetical protein
VASLNVDAEEENEDSTGKVEVADKEEEVKDEKPIEDPVKDEPVDDEIINLESDEEDFTFESLDDKSFNKLVTRYINEVYDNVDKFESTDGTIDDVANNFIVEGVVTYKNGKQAKTKFVFEAVAKTKSGSYKFKGSNKMFTEAKKPFTLISTIKDNTLYCEELKYHYNVTVLNESKKVKGKIALKNN